MDQFMSRRSETVREGERESSSKMIRMKSEHGRQKRTIKLGEDVAFY